MKKIVRIFLLVAAFAAVISFFSDTDSSTSTKSAEPAAAPYKSPPPTKRPNVEFYINVEFAYGFKFVKLRVYSCKPCSESQANSAARLLAESGKVTAHAFFDMDDAAFKDLEAKISSAGSFVNAEQIINAANPKQFRRVMANGKMMAQ